jgi:hypothetical protein
MAGLFKAAEHARESGFAERSPTSQLQDGNVVLLPEDEEYSSLGRVDRFKSVGFELKDMDDVTLRTVAKAS